MLEAIGDLDVDDALDALEARGSILRRPHSEIHGDVEFAFKHALILDVAYGTLPRTTRRNLHAAIAQYVEGLADPADLAWLLAHHWREAGDLDVARGYLLAAAERACAVLAVEQPTTCTRGRWSPRRPTRSGVASGSAEGSRCPSWRTSRAPTASSPS